MDNICGRWKVKMRGWWWFWFRDEKIIWQNKDGSIQGLNVLWGFIKWGEFDVEFTDMLPDAAFFKYKHFEDCVDIDEDSADGLLWIRELNLASFTMERIES